ncbi:putative tetratricopeptide-like helical domain superfamily [Helianthus annuus]|nr:putative tetratricopeptide-like helical domain superfamily [Helianthus annuus]
MVVLTRNRGLEPCTRTLNYFVGVAVEMGSVEVAHKVFDEMCERGATPDSSTFKILITYHCKVNEVSLVDQWFFLLLLV